MLLAVGWEESGAQEVLVRPQAPPARWALLWAQPTQPVVRAWRGLVAEAWSAASRRVAPVWAAAGSWVTLVASPARVVWAAVAQVEALLG